MDEKTFPTFKVPSGFVVILLKAVVSSASAQATPVIVIVSDPMLAIMREADSPEAMPEPSTTMPPKSTSGGVIVKKALLLTVVPVRLIGKVLAYLGTPLVV